MVAVSWPAARGAPLSITARAHGLRQNAHSAGVRGIATAGPGHVLTVGADGLLRAWRVDRLSCGGAEGAAGGGAGWAESVLVPCWRVAVSIEQVHALCVCLPTAAAEGEEEEHAAVAVVVGCGVEAFPIWCKAGSVERMVAE